MDILVEYLEIAKSYRVEIMEIMKIGYTVIVLFIILISGYFWGAFFYNIKWKRELIKKGYAEYNSQTGKWQWKDDKETDEILDNDLADKAIDEAMRGE
jgi:hypothetical protein